MEKHTELLRGKQSCGKCRELEQTLLQKGKSSLEDMKNYKKPELPKSSCEQCSMLLLAWNRYFTILENMRNYIYRKQLPQEPKFVHTACSGCNNIQKSDKEYADNLKKELECREKGSKGDTRSCVHVKYTGGDYKADKNCGECREIYNTWQLYIFSLISLVNYYRFSKQNLKPIV